MYVCMYVCMNVCVCVYVHVLHAGVIFDVGGCGL